MRRALILSVLVGLAIAGCGSSSSGSPRDTELSYFPSGSPFVAVLATDPNGTAYQNASGFVARFPVARFGLAALESSLSRSGVNYNQDIKPLLGNPVALGSATASTASQSRFLLVFVAQDAGKLNALTQRQPAPQKARSYDGATLYQGGSYALALNGATAVLAPSMDDVKSALDRHAHGGGITATAFNQALTGLPQNALLQVYGSLSGLLATPAAAQARQVPWVAAIRSYAATVSVADTGITAAFRVDTSGSSLTAGELPLPTGGTGPSVAGPGPLVVGVNDLAHVFGFGESAAQAVDPSGFAKFAQRAAKDGVDLNRDLFSQFTGSSEIDYGSGGVVARADLANAATAQQTLSKLKGLRRTTGGFYVSKNGRTLVGIVGSRLVIGRASEAALRAFAAAPGSPIAGAPGPVAFRIALGSLISLGLASSHSSGGSLNPLNPQVAAVLNQFGDITGYAVNDASGLHGSFTLPLK